MICPKCGKENDNDALYCGGCGASLIEINTSSDIAHKINDSNDKEEIKLVLKPNTDAEISRIEDSLNKEEEDLRDVLSSTTTAAVQMGNAQAQTVVHQATNEVEENLPNLELPPTKTEELIAQKQKEKAERDARLEAQRRELEKELNAKKEAPKQEKVNTQMSDDKFKAILSYFLPITWIIAYFMAGKNRSDYLNDKLNESLVLNILHILRFLPLVGNIAFALAIILKILGIFNTYTDKNDKIPYISDIKLLKKKW